jgi:hypothetical protein
MQSLLTSRINWQDKLAKDTPDRFDSLLPETDINASVKLRQVESDVLTKLVLEGSVPEVKLNISQSKAMRLLRIIQVATKATGHREAKVSSNMPQVLTV